MKKLKSYNNERGAVLVISLMFIAILAMLGATGVVLTTTDMQIGSNYRSSQQAFFDADAGVNYAIYKMQEGLKNGAFPSGYPSLEDGDMPIGDTTSLPFTAPSGFNFSYMPTGAPVLTKIASNRFSFTTTSVGPNNSTATLATTCSQIPAINFGVFGDYKVDVGNTAGIYSYSSSDSSITYPLTPSQSTTEVDIGSNKKVILRNNCVVDGDVALGDYDSSGTETEGVVEDHGGVVNGTIGEDIERVDSDPLGLGITDGRYYTKLSTYSVSNDNDCNYDYVNNGCTERYVYGDSNLIEDDVANDEINLGNGESLTLKGKSGGANYYFTDIVLGTNSTLYIDTTDGPVNIYLTGDLESKNGSNIITTANDTSCPSTNTDPCCSCGTSCNFGLPGDFAIFANTTTETLTIKNSAEFFGLIYAPYTTVRMDNSANIHGAIFAQEVEIVNSVEIYFDTDMKDDYLSTDLVLTTWRNIRAQ